MDTHHQHHQPLSGVERNVEVVYGHSAVLRNLNWAHNSTAAVARNYDPTQPRPATHGESAACATQSQPSTAGSTDQFPSLQDLLAELHHLRALVKTLQVQQPCGLCAIRQPRYIPYPLDPGVPSIINFPWAVFTPQEIQINWNQKPGLVIQSQQITLRMPELMFWGAGERIFLETGTVKDTLYRGHIVKFNFFPYAHDFEHQFFISNTQFIGSTTAYLKVVGYNRFGARVHPYDCFFGTFILVIPRQFCDVIFPPLPELHQHAILATTLSPHYHQRIRAAAGVQD